ncbi:MAG: hypothetical protein AMJ79_11625, partial [Phycisphaerae bacterium SM23_30]
MQALSKFCCQNKRYPDYGKRGANNLTVCGWFGKNNHIRLLYCRTCKSRFSERKGTPLFRMKLPEKKAISLLEHLSESCGVRKTERLVGVNRNTVMRYARLAGEHAKALHDELVAFSPQTNEVQFDEKWAFVGKKEQHCHGPEAVDSKQGDNWDHVAYDPEHRLVVSVVPGKRTAKNIKKLGLDFKQRTQGRRMNLMTSDEYKPHKKALLKAYGRTVKPPRTGKRGHPKGSHLMAAPGLTYATVHKTRRKGRVVKITLRAVFGSKAQVAAAIATSAVSNTVNTAF